MNQRTLGRVLGKKSEKFVKLGDASNCILSLLDSGKAANDQYFWEEVQNTFVLVEKTMKMGRCFFREEHKFVDRSDIDPSKIAPHEWKKLRTTWKYINDETTKFLPLLQWDA